MRILEVTSQVTGVSVADILSKTRKVEAVRARFIAFYALRVGDELSWSEIGRAFERDHSTVIHGVTAITNDYMNNFQNVRESLDKVMLQYKSQ